MEQLTFASDAVELIVLPEVGARMHRLRAFGHDVLRTPDDVAVHRRDPFFWGSYVMAPWCNRIAPGRVAVGGMAIDLPANFPDGTAIHGQVYDRSWTVRDDGQMQVRVAGTRWPWAYAVTQRVAVEGATVRLGLGLTNESDQPMPAGLGIHPWFRPPVQVAVPATTVYASNTDSPPQPVPVTGRHDLRKLRAMAPDLDATWADLTEPTVRFRWPELGVRMTMRFAPDGFVVAANPTHLDAVAVEPETHAPQGIRRLLNDEPGALTMLAPSATITLDIELSFETAE